MICRSRRTSDPVGCAWSAFARTVVLACAIGISSGHIAQAQALSMPDMPVITIEPDRLFAATTYGQEVARELEERGAALRAENRQIEAALAEEESELTAQRPTMTPEAFRALANEFDEKVQSTRAEQDEKARLLNEDSTRAQQEFLQAIAPVLEILMIERGAAVILDRRAVFISLDASDMTDQAIARINEALSPNAGTKSPDQE